MLCGHPGARPGSAPAVVPPDWPLTSYLELGAQPGAVPCARAHTRAILWEWRLTALAEGAELAVSELVTNAIRATGPDSPVRLWLRSDGAQLLAEVWDDSDWLPVPQEQDPDATSGRGLLLVEAVSKNWGSFALGPSAGKIVWARFA